MIKNNGDMIKGILVLAIPAMIENILQVLIGLVDTYFISKLGSEAIGGVGVTNLTVNIYMAFFQAIGIGTTAILTRSIGGKDIKRANTVVEQSIIFSTAIGLFFGIINLLFSENILVFLGIKNNILEYALPYFRSVSIPIIFLCLMTILSSILRGMGDTKNPMIVATISNIINIILNYILMFGIFNFKGLGILGAGIATTISRIIGVILLIIIINKSNTEINIRKIKYWNINKKSMIDIAKLGLPAGIERLIMRFGQLIYGKMVIQVGVQAYAAHNIAGQIESFSYLPAMAFGISASTLVGQSLGSSEVEKAEKYGKLSYMLSTLFMVIIGVFFYIFAPNLARIFSKDVTIIDSVIRVLRLIALFQPMLASTQVITAALQGAGDTKFPMYSTFFGIWGIRVLGVYLLKTYGNLTILGVWLMYAIDITFRGTLLMLRFKKGNWKNIKI